jgi:RHS repeat-associated protein
VDHPDPARNTTALGYDGAGRLTSVTDANGHTTLSGFDLLSRLISRTLPAGGASEAKSYDVLGNLLTETDLNGRTTNYSYDTLERLLSITPDAGLSEPAVSFTYTATGRRASMTDATGTTNYTYDNLDRLTVKATPQGMLAYTYDPAGNVTSISSSNANGVSVNYLYDELNRLSAVIDNRLPAGQNTTTYDYDPVSNLATVTYPNGVQSTFTYDALNRLNALNSTRASYTYGLDPAGRLRSLSESGGRQVSWTYDGIYRLTSETDSRFGAASYGLDPVGNRSSCTATLPGIASGTFSYDANDRLSTDTYYPNGNTQTSGARSFRYDFANRLKDVNNGQISMVYDGDGNRVGKGATQYLVDDLNPTGLAQVVEEIAGSAVQRVYTYGQERISQRQATGVSFYGYDGQGNVRLLTDAAGAVTDTYAYDAWGNVVDSTGSTPNVYRYRGEQYDADLNLYYLRARYFNPLTGRFLTTDPLAASPSDPSSLNRYAYAAADPVNNSDPTGMLAPLTATEVAGEIILEFVYPAGAAPKPLIMRSRVAEEYFAVTRMSMLAFAALTAQYTPAMPDVIQERYATRLQPWIDCTWTRTIAALACATKVLNPSLPLDAMGQSALKS